MISTDYILSHQVSARELFDGRLENSGIREQVSPETHESTRCLTDGRNYLWVDITEDGLVGCLTRYGANDPSNILSAIAETFDCQIFSEYVPQYWGFDTQQEWDAAIDEMAAPDRDKFYRDVCAYVQGEANDIRPGTVGEERGQDRQKTRRGRRGSLTA